MLSLERQEDPPSLEEFSPEWIEQQLDLLVRETLIDAKWRNTAKVVLYAFMVGTNPDKIAKATGLNRDFVRARAKILRENHIFITEPMKPGKIGLSSPADKDFDIELMLIVMCAEGIVSRSSG